MNSFNLNIIPNTFLKTSKPESFWCLKEYKVHMGLNLKRKINNIDSKIINARAAISKKIYPMF